MTMFDYTIARTADENIYIEQIKALEKRSGFIALKRVQDVDGSDACTVKFTDGKATVYYDTDVDATYIKSDVALDEHLVGAVS